MTHSMAKHKQRKHFDVEDHGNGFMVIGTPFPHVAIKVLAEYVDSVRAFRICCPTNYKGRSAVWFTTAHGEFWEGARDHMGNEIARSGA